MTARSFFRFSIRLYWQQATSSSLVFSRMLPWIWQNGQRVLCWAASALLMTEQSFRKIMGYRDLWMLKAALGGNQDSLEEKVA